MFKHFKNKFLPWVILKAISGGLWPSLLVAICCVIAILNYTPGTWLTGWDTLHPEFNFPLNISRSIFGVWREDQGLGTLAAHSHMSELPRILMMWFSSLFLPLSTLRYLYIFICFVLGPLGIYYFTLNSIIRKQTVAGRAAAFLAALAYIFNLGTVQHFYVVFEMFAVQYAALGWLFLWATKIFEKNKNRDKIIFFAISFLAAPMAYASLLWWAYAGSLGLYIFGLMNFKIKRQILGPAIQIGLLTFGANAFWLIPNLYFIVSGSSNIVNNSYINKLFSPEAFLHNQSYGNLKDLALLKNFLFNWSELSPDKKFVPLLRVWSSHLQMLPIMYIGFGVFLSSLAGLISGVVRKNKQAVALLPVLIVSGVMLINQNPPFTLLFSFLRQHISLFEEGLRFPFTKFSLVFMLPFFVYFGLFWHLVFEKASRLISDQKIIMVTALLSMLLLVYGAPMFGGFLLNPKMRNSIPAAYSELFEVMKNQPATGRVAVLPLATSFGWEYTNWNYEGPGFIWFGIPQPVLVRDFDRWSINNENFYKQLSTSVYGNETYSFFKVLNDYNVSYILIDESIFNPGQTQEFLHLAQIKAYLSGQGVQPFWQKDNLSVYKVGTPNTDFLQTPSTTTWVQADTDYVRKNVVLEQEGDYLESKKEQGSTKYYPFSNLLSDKSLTITTKDERTGFSYHLPKSNQSLELKLPALIDNSIYSVPLELEYSGTKLSIKFLSPSSLKADDQNLDIPALGITELILPEPFDQIIVDIGTKQIPLNQGSMSIGNLLLNVNRPITINAFSKADVVSENNELFVDPTDVTSVELPATVWREVKSSHIVTLPEKANTVLVELNTVPEPISLESSNILNCDPDKRGLIKKEILIKGVSYSASNYATLCDGQPLPEIRTDVSYLVSIQGKGEKGRGLKLYLENNLTRRKDLEILLPTAEYQQVFSLPSWPFLDPDAYYLSFETKSFGNNESKNYLEDLQFTPTNLDWLAKITIIQKDVNPVIYNSATINKSWKFGNHNYGADVAVKDDGLLALMQGYHPGWLGILLPSNGSQNRLQLLPHVEYNGWANAWILPTGTYSVMLLYWPQLLSFAGFGLLFTTGIWLTVRALKR